MNLYVDKFRKIRRDIDPKNWDSTTKGGAPHKPILLLAVMDLIEEGVIERNFVELTPELIQTFSHYWSKIMPPERKGNIVMPFFHLKSSGFWHLLPQPGRETILANIHQMTSIKELTSNILAAYLEEELYAQMCDPTQRDLLRVTLIETFFSPTVQPLILELSRLNIEIFEYSQELLRYAQQQPFQISDTFIETEKPAVRDQGFRKAIVRAYNHRCAICGVRMITPNGYTVVDAAHIIPWSISHNDDPRNGIALCRLCHWTFDQGLVGITSGYVVILSSMLNTNDNIPGHLLMQNAREIIKPIENILNPNVKALEWHLANTFLK